jgi:hypothetical protein
MFVPIHRRRRAASGRNAQVKVKPAVMAAVSAVLAVMVSSLLHTGRSGGGGNVVVVGLAIGIGAAALGLALARAIGRQGKI